MYPQPFEYVSPGTLDEAIDFLKDHEDEAKIISGGQSLVPLLKTRLASFSYLVDISGISDLKFHRKDGNTLMIGSLTTTSEIEESSLIRQECHVLAETATQVADPQIRNMGTIGGNLVHGDPGNDFPTPMMALDAKYVLHSSDGKRVVNASDFYLDSYFTDIKEDEILTEIQVPVIERGSGAAYVKQKRRAGDFSIAAVAAYISLTDGSICDKVALATTSIGPVNARCTEAEKFLLGKRLDQQNIEAAARIVVEESDSKGDAYATREVKERYLEIVTVEAIIKAKDRALGV